jgi:hypothetical protein
MQERARHPLCRVQCVMAPDMQRTHTHDKIKNKPQQNLPPPSKKKERKRKEKIFLSRDFLTLIADD